jgi:hypothetical protein
MTVLQDLSQHGELLVEILDECLHLMQLFGGYSGELDPFGLLFRDLFVTATGHLSVSQLGIGKGLHSDSYPFPPGAFLSSIASLEILITPASCVGRCRGSSQRLRATLLK